MGKNNKGKKGQPTKSKKEKQLEQYYKHQCQSDEPVQHNKQSQQQDQYYDNIAEQLQNIDPNAPLPDFSDFNKNQELVRNIMEDINNLVQKIDNKEYDKLQEPQKQKQTLSKDNVKKRDEYVKHLRSLMKIQNQKKQEIEKLSQQEDMEDIKDILSDFESTLQFDIDRNEDVCKMLLDE